MGLLVRWELPEPSTTHAEAASHEVDACEEPASGSSSRQTVPGRVRECTFANLHPGTLYQVSHHPHPRSRVVPLTSLLLPQITYSNGPRFHPL